MSTDNLRAVFSKLDLRLRNVLADEDSPLKLIELALYLAETEAGVEYLSLDEVVEVLEAADVAVSRKSLARAVSRAGGRLKRRDIAGEQKYALMTRGRREVEPTFDVGDLEVIFIDGDRPRSARREVGDLFRELQGLVRICDPYYGVRTLEILEMVPEESPVCFLTGRTSESNAKLAGPLGDFKKERPNVELRLVKDPRSLHDRYVVTSDRLLLIGHGLKDIGGKQSFAVALPSSMASGLIEEVTHSFDRNWARASPL